MALDKACFIRVPRSETHHFDIARIARGLWNVADRYGMIGGMFRTRKAAFRFAMSETDGVRACILFRKSRHGHRRVWEALSVAAGELTVDGRWIGLLQGCS